jgi:LysR family transcriptional regulator, nitrogen assimilation regulatory protein
MHLRPTRLRELGPLKIVLPSHANARRKPLETYCTTNGVEIERVVEMDAMMGTLDLVSNSDWVTIIPALMMTPEIKKMQFTVVPLIEPTAPLDLVLIEPMRRTLNAPAQAFLDILRTEALNLNNLWNGYFE